MQQYKDLVIDVLKNGVESDDRTGTGTISVFGRQTSFDLKKGFPLVTLKKTYWKGVVIELLWFLRGDTNIKWLQKHKVSIWDSWANSNGDLGRIYSAQWREWKNYKGETTDQISNLINNIKKDPNSRRHLVIAFNPGELDEMSLPACHSFFQFYVKEGKLSCQLYQRSADLFLGVPFNIASYSLLTHLVANECGLEVGEFVHTFGDLHLYKNHIKQAKEMIAREPKSLSDISINLPKRQLLDFIDNKVEHMSWDEIKNIIKLDNYQYHPTIKADVSV